MQVSSLGTELVFCVATSLRGEFGDWHRSSLYLLFICRLRHQINDGSLLSTCRCRTASFRMHLRSRGRVIPGTLPLLQSGSCPLLHPASFTKPTEGPGYIHRVNELGSTEKAGKQNPTCVILEHAYISQRTEGRLVSRDLLLALI
jgi:hypothetical protein